MAIRLGELATRFGCDLKGDPDIVIDSVASLGNAGAGQLSFLSNSKLRPQLASTNAAAVIVRSEDVDAASTAVLISDDPYASYARMAAVVHPPRALRAGVHASAVVAQSASVADSAEVSANAVIDDDVVIGEHAFIGPGCYVGPGCHIGADCRLVANVTLARAVTLGDRSIIHPGAVIGADGFGNAMTPEGWIKVPQLGGVQIGSDVEIGASTTVDCGALGDTVIEDGVRIDNLCMIAHNVRVGAHTAMAAMTGIAGSAVIGKRCMFAGQSGSVGHISICDDVVVSGQGMISKSITEPGVYASHFPAEPAGDWNRKIARFRRIESLFKRVGRLEKGDK
ncbi:MAG: UDP-3-O-(3-hydroxymyristoyl)glucosamine N-acyltransferase [Woeseiaceae bacterium]|nr:UDP-3-O-(3-hydroxymyristoyl)glucosamine N-acyltransferase [Woeseiaceae bacterium]